MIKLKWLRKTYADGTTESYVSECGSFAIEPYFGSEIEHGSPGQRQGWILALPYLGDDGETYYEWDRNYEPSSFDRAKRAAEFRANLQAERAA